MAANHEQPFDDIRSTFHEYVRVLRRRWRLALVAACLVSSVAFWVSQYLPRQYSAATIFERRDDVVLRNLIHSNSPYSFDQLKSSIALDMTGSRALAEAATAIGLLAPDAITSEQALTNQERRLLDRALAESDLRAHVRLVHSSPSLDTIELDCTGNDPAVVSRFIVALRDLYIERTRERITEILTGTRDFFASEVSRFQQRINAAREQREEQFVDFPGVDPSDPASAGARLEALRSERLRLTQRTAELEAQIAARERFLSSSLLTEPTEVRPTASTPPRPPPANTVIQRTIDQVEQELCDAIVLHRMTEEHPTVKALQRKIATLYAAQSTSRPPQIIADAPATAEPSAAERLRRQDPVLAAQRLRVELELEALRTQHELANAHLEEAAARVLKLSSLYERLLETSDDARQVENQLEQDTATAAIWRQHLAQLERIVAAESEQRGTQFALIEEPKESTHATRPQAIAVLIICLGGGLAAALVVIALTELTDHTFRSAGQVTRALSMPVLERIGVIDTPRVRRRQLLWRLAWSPAVCILAMSLLATASLAYTSLEHPDLHRRAISKLDTALQTVGAPPTSLVRESKE